MSLIEKLQASEQTSWSHMETTSWESWKRLKSTTSTAPSISLMLWKRPPSQWRICSYNLWRLRQPRRTACELLVSLHLVSKWANGNRKRQNLIHSFIYLNRIRDGLIDDGSPRALCVPCTQNRNLSIPFCIWSIHQRNPKLSGDDLAGKTDPGRYTWPLYFCNLPCSNFIQSSKSKWFPSHFLQEKIKVIFSALSHNLIQCILHTHM